MTELKFRTLSVLWKECVRRGEGKMEIGHGERRREQLCVVYFVPNFGEELQFTHFIVIIVVAVALETLSIWIICVYYMST